MFAMFRCAGRKCVGREHVSQWTCSGEYCLFMYIIIKRGVSDAVRRAGAYATRAVQRTRYGRGISGSMQAASSVNCLCVYAILCVQSSIVNRLVNPRDGEVHT